MSRAAPFLIDDLLPAGARLLAVRPVRCRALADMAEAEGLAPPAGQVGPALAAVGGRRRALVLVVQAADLDDAVARFATFDLPGLVVAIEGCGAAASRSFARRLALRLVGAGAARYRAKMRRLAMLIDPGAPQALPAAEDLTPALGWRARLYSRALGRFLRRNGSPGGARPARPDPLRLASRRQLAHEEAVLDRLIAEEQARQLTFFRGGLAVRRCWQAKVGA